MSRVLLAVVAVTALLALACDRGQPAPAAPEPAAPPKTALRIQLNWVPEPEFGGLYAAQMKGFFAEEGLDVELIKGAASIPSPQLTAAGQVELGVVGGDQVALLRSRGAPLKALYASFQTDPRAVVVHEASPHQSLEALWRSDARIALEAGSPFERWLDLKYGGERLQKVPSNGSLATFMADPAMAQAVFVFAEPVELKSRQVPVRVFPVADSGYNPYGQVVATSDGWLKDHPREAAAAVRAIRKGWEAYLADPGPVNAHLAELNPAMSRASMDIAAELEAPYVRGPGAAPLGSMEEARWAALIDQLKTLGVIETAPPAASCFAMP